MTSSSSSGARTNFITFHTNSEAGETSGVEKPLLSIQNLGSDVCSCLTAAEHSAVVLAGNNISNCTLGGKTTTERYLQYSERNEVLINGQLGSNPSSIQHPRGIMIRNIKQYNPQSLERSTQVSEEV